MLNYPYHIVGTGAHPEEQELPTPYNKWSPPTIFNHECRGERKRRREKKKKREGRKKRRKISPLNLHPKFTTDPKRAIILNEFREFSPPPVPPNKIAPATRVGST